MKKYNVIMGLIIAAMVLCLLSPVFGKVSSNDKNKETINETIQRLRPLFDALYERESSSGKDKRDGDDGKAIGPYQIWEVYYTDAEMTDGSYQDCLDKAYAERVIIRYWQRYARQALREGKYEVLARTHNGGPQGATRRSTIKYWNDVQKILEDQKTK